MMFERSAHFQALIVLKEKKREGNGKKERERDGWM
jgi:hypothetical protein